MPIELDKNLLDAKILNEIKLKTLDYSISNIDHADIELSLNQRIENVDLSISAVGKSNNYNDLDNLPNLTTKIENIDVQNASGVTQFTTDGNDLKLDLNDFIVNNLTKVISKYAPTGTSNNNIYYISNSSVATPRVNDPLRPYSSINAIVSPPLFAVIIYLPGSYSSENFNFNRLGDLVILYPNVSITVSNTTTGVLFSRIIGLDKNSSVINFNSKAPNFQISLIKGITGNNMPSVDGNTGNIALSKREDCIFNVTGTSASTVVGEFERCTINLPSTQIHSLSGSFKFCSVNNIFRIAGYFENCFIDKINHTYLDQFVSFTHEFINCRIKNYKITALGSSIINPMTIPKLSYYNTDIINDDGLPIINGVADPQGIVVSRLTTKNILSNVPILGANSVATLRIGIPETVDTNFTQF